MAVNTSPIFPVTPHIGWGTVTTADATAANNHTGASSSAVCLFTAGAYGSRIDKIKVVPLGTNVATVLRLFVTNTGANTSAANNSLIKEIAFAASTISETAIMAEQEWSPDQASNRLDMSLPPGYKLYAIVGTTVAAGLQVTVFGGDY